MGRRLRIVEHAQQHVRHFPAVFPVPEATRRHDPVRPHRAHDEVQAREEVHEEIAGDAGAVVTVVAPPEDPERVEGALGRVPEIPDPIHRFLGPILGDRVLPGAHG